MGKFIEILWSFNNVNRKLNDGDNLTRFIDCLKKYNGNKEINSKFKKKLERFFDYKWDHDKLLAFWEPADLENS